MSDVCINHPTRKAIVHCKKCRTPLCTDCRRISPSLGVFCSAKCEGEFAEFQGQIRNSGPRRKHFSILGCLRTFVLSIVLLVVIWFVLTAWLGSSDPSQMWAELRRIIKLAF